MSVVRGPSGPEIRHCFRRGLLSAAFLAAVTAAGWSQSLADTPRSLPVSGPLNVFLDQAQAVKLPDKVATLVIGNPLIADVSIQAGGVMIVTGKGFGATNLLAFDRAGNVLTQTVVQVQGPRDNIVIVYRGMERESYSCMPKCERRITLGDSPPYFDSVLGQTASRNGAAQSGAQAIK
jgi:Flp pilus assembly secretin CpaC